MEALLREEVDAIFLLEESDEDRSYGQGRSSTNVWTDHSAMLQWVHTYALTVPPPLLA